MYPTKSWKPLCVRQCKSVIFALCPGLPVLVVILTFGVDAEIHLHLVQRLSHPHRLQLLGIIRAPRRPQRKLQKVQLAWHLLANKNIELANNNIIRIIH